MRGSRSWLLLLALALAAALYVPVLGAAFVADDYPDVAYLARASFLDLLRDGLWGVPGGAGRYRPVLHLSAWLDWCLWGTVPFGYHLTSLLLHLASGGLLFACVRRLLAAWSARERSELAAGAAALVWLLHPLHPEAVAWFAARGSVLAAFFALLALYCFLRAREPGTARGWWLAALLAALAAHLSHESVILLPLLPALVELFAPRRDAAHGGRPRAALRAFAVFGAALAICLGLRVLFVREAFGGELTEILAKVPPDSRLPLLLSSLRERAELLVLPVHPAVTGSDGLRILAGLLLGLVLAAALPALRGRRVLVAFAGIVLAIGVLYLPSSVVQIRAADHANTRQLYALLLPFALLVGGALALLPRRPAVGLLLCLGVTYLAGSLTRNLTWRDAAATADRWAAAARAQAGRDPSAKIFLFDPPLARDGILILENAIGSLVAPPFHSPAQECHLMLGSMLQGLAVVPEGQAFRREPHVFVCDFGESLHGRRLPPRPEALPRPWRGARRDAVEIPSFDVAAIRAEVQGQPPLVWRAADGLEGWVAPWPFPGAEGRAVLYPVGSELDWLLAGQVVSVEIRAEEVGEVALLDRLPGLEVDTPPDGFVVRRGAPPPRFAGRTSRPAANLRFTFFSWPGPVVVPVPIGIVVGGDAVLTPGREPSLDGAFAWSVFEDRILFVPALAAQYWCLEELDARGRPVARSELRRLMPGR